MSARIASALAGLFVAALITGFAAQVAAGGFYRDVTLQVSAVTTVAVGWVLCVRRPGHRVGWIVLALGCSACLQAAVAGYLATQPSPGWLYTTLLWIDGRSFLTLWAGLIALFFNFPDGRLPSPRWRRPAKGAAAVIVGGFVLTGVMPGPLSDELPASLPNPMNPLGLRADLWERIEFLNAVGLLGLVLSVLVALTSLVVRYRRSKPEQRLQIRWVVTAAIVFVALLMVNVAVRATAPALLPVTDLLTGAAFTLLPLSVGVAVLRYRLYEIDRVINRTAVYTILTTVLAAAYLAVVTAARAVTEPVTGDAAVAVAASTLLVAALFQPLRRRIQQAVDRRFNRARYDAAATIEGFSTRLRDEIDLQSLRGELVDVVAATMQPARTILWLREIR